MPEYNIPPFAKECMEHAGQSWGKSFDHPFVKSLADGTLESEKFAFYQMQDARYLEAFSDACAILSTKVKDPKEKLWFVDAARMALIVEGQLHAGYGEKLGYTAEDIAKLELTPNNIAYENHMIAIALTGSLVEGIAAITPCPWLYIELGQHLVIEMGSVPENHPYADWLKMYSDPGFNEYMDVLLGLLQKYSEGAGFAEKSRAKTAFHTSVRYEWMFWDQAYRMQKWSV